MRVIIAGSRSFTDYDLVDAATRKCGFVISEVVSGCARGIDNLGLVWALNNNIPVKKFPAELNFALSADLGGFARNGEMRLTPRR